MQASERTNEKVNQVLAEINTLILWAEADADQSQESGAKDQERADRARAAILRKAHGLVAKCRRY